MQDWRPEETRYRPLTLSGILLHIMQLDIRISSTSYSFVCDSLPQICDGGVVHTWILPRPFPLELKGRQHTAISATADGGPQPPINTSGNFPAHMSETLASFL